MKQLKFKKWQVLSLLFMIPTLFFAQRNLTSNNLTKQHVQITNTARLNSLPERISLPLAIENRTYTLELEKKSNRSINYNIVLHKDDGSFETVPNTPVNTYIGNIKELEGYTVGAMVENGVLNAKIFTPNEEEYELKAQNGAYALIKNTELKIACNGACSLPNDAIQPSTSTSVKSITTGTSSNLSLQGAKKSAAVAKAGETVKQAEIGFDIAYSAYSKHYASDRSKVTANIEEFVNTTLNSIWIRDALVEHLIGTVVIRTSAASCPYEKAGNRKVNIKTLEQIRSIWNSGKHGNTHNLATLHVGDGGGGLAWIGTISENSRYSATGQTARGLHGFGRHEVAHNWGLSHSHGRREVNNKGEQYGLMWVGPHDRATADESKSMIAERNSSGLRDIGPYRKKNIKPYGKRDDATVSANASVTIDVLANDHDANADNISLGSFDAKSKKGGTIRKSGNKLIYTAGSQTGEDIFYYNVSDGKSSNWGIVYVNVKASINPNVTVNTNLNEYNYDLGTVDSPVQSGWTRISNKTTGDITWSTNQVEAADRGEISGVNTINRDFVFGRNASGRATLNHKIKNGTWNIVMNMGDANYAHDNVSVKIEGKTVATNVKNAIKEFPYVNANNVEVRDGILNIEVADNGGNDKSWVWTRLSLKRAGNLPTTGPVPPPPPPTPTPTENNTLVIQAENFSNTGGTHGGFQTYTTGGVTAINNNQTGDWAEYTVNIPETASYAVEYFIGTPLDGAAIDFIVDGASQMKTNVPNNGSWDSFKSLKANQRVTLSSGTHVIRLLGAGTNGWEWNMDRFVLSSNSGAKNDVVAYHDLMLHPNPANDTFTINGVNQEDLTINIYDLKGVKYFSKKSTPTARVISVENLSDGIYFVLISNTSGTFTKTVKLLKKTM